MTCGATQQRMSAVLTGSAGRNELLDVETHVRRCARCADVYRDLIATSVAVDRAYASLRGASAVISPARVRLALRLPQPVPASARFSRVAARVNEIALAAAVTAFAFVGSASVAPKHTLVDEFAPDTTNDTLTHVTASADDQYFLRWLRLGRYASPADMLDPAITPKAYFDDLTNTVTQERAGLLR
jgi:hypothetical protein